MEDGWSSAAATAASAIVAAAVVATAAVVAVTVVSAAAEEKDKDDDPPAAVIVSEHEISPRKKKLYRLRFSVLPVCYMICKFWNVGYIKKNDEIIGGFYEQQRI